MQQTGTQTASSPIGVLILGRKRPGFDQEWNQIVCRRSIAALKDLGYTTVGADEPVIDGASITAALDKIEQAGCRALVMLQPSMGHGQLALAVAQRWVDPVVLWATPERPGDGKVSSCSLVGQHLWGASLRQAGHSFELVYGDPDETGPRADLVRAIAVARTVAGLRLAKVGVIGTHAPGFIDLAADLFLMRRTLGVQIVPLSLPQYIERVRAVPEEAVCKDLEAVLDMKLPMNGITADALPVNSRCYLAMLELIEEENLDGLALQCWPELPNIVGQWPYLAIARLSTEGRAVAMEGDVDGCVAGLMNALLGLGPGFLTDWLEHDRNTIFFWHPGMAPMNMCNPVGSECGPTLTNHFNIVKPLVVDAQIRTNEPVTVTRLWRCDDRYHMTAFEGRTITPRRKLTGNSALVELTESDVARDGSVPERFDRLVHAGMPHHVILSFGKHAETFQKACEGAGFGMVGLIEAGSMSQEHEKPYKVYLAGQWIATGEEIQVTNPATGQTFARVCAVNRDHVRTALEAAQASFAAWRAITAKERGALLDRAADELHRRSEEIARIITLENGKPLAQSRGEVAMTEDHLGWFAEEGRRAYGRVIPHQVQGKRNLTVKTPIGVVGAISPWNFPLVLAARKVAPALAAGCPVVLKPSSRTPLCAIAFAECAEAAGIPGGVFQLVIGNARMISEEFLANPICRKITFTGSTEVGRELIRGAAPFIKPLSLELGGLAPLLVFEDCDLDQAVRETLVAKFRNSGQSCIAANRIYVQRSIHEAFLSRFVAAVKKLKTGAGLDADMDVGPLIGQEALDDALGQIADAAGRGARIVCGGKRIAGMSGYFLEPTVIDGAKEDFLCMREETFAPIAPVATFETEAEAIEFANHCEYGLSAYAMTRDVARIFRLAEQIEAGTLGINDGAPTTSQCPFGGVKQSGWGRELGGEGLEAFLETKHVSIGGI